MEFEFDPEKDAINILKHGMSLGDFSGFDDEPSVSLDTRFNYNELRYRVFGRIGGIGYCAVLTKRGNAVRIISFRRAHDKEMRRHE